MMISQKPVVVRRADGTIDPDQSYVHVHEQKGEGTRTENLNYPQENGVVMRPLGTIDRKYTFQQLLDKGYIPFTLKEFIGEDPVESGKAWLGTENSALKNGADLIAGHVFSQTLYANYNVCSIKVEVKDPDGTVLVSYTPHIATNPKLLRCPLIGGLNKDRVTAYADGKNTIHIYAQLSTGELVDAFHTILKME